MKKQGIDRLTLFLIPIGVAVNVIGGTVIGMLKLPLYLDAIGTIIVGALCGAIPGALVGFASNVINAIFSPTTFFYFILNVAFGIGAGFFSKKGVFKSIWKSAVSVFYFAFVGGGFGAVITWIIYGFDFGASSWTVVAIFLYENLKFPKFFAAFITEFGVDIFDKALTVAIIFLVLKAMPVNLLAKLPLGEIYIKDEDKEDDEDEE